jgi:blue copper oxidase
MKRRNFIKQSGAAIATAYFLPTMMQGCGDKNNNGMGMESALPINDTGFDVALPIPTEVGATTTLTAKSSSFSMLKGKTTSTLTYQNGILGPTIRVNNGQVVAAQLVNNLSEQTNIHWHGLKVPSDMDGHPNAAVLPGGSFDYVLPINQRAGTYWYHPHPDMITGRQIHAGLAGMFIVNDSEEAALNLPVGKFEIPLIIQDKRFNGDQLLYAPSMMDVMTGYFGDTVIVNGATTPFHNVDTRWYRFRLLNGSTARVYNLALSNGADMNVIGNDGGLLSVPTKVKEILLAPGERADVLINFTGLAIGSEVSLISKTFNGSNVQGLQQFNIMKFIVGAIVTDTFQLPSKLSTITTLASANASKTRSFDVSVAPGGGMGRRELMHTINGKKFDMARIDETVQAGATEIWEFKNLGDDLHPIHLHAVQFQILARTGGRALLIALESGWKDTVLLMPNEKVSLIMTFPLGNKGMFVFHCHNIEHEDDGMMLNFEIV